MTHNPFIPTPPSYGGKLIRPTGPQPAKYLIVGAAPGQEESYKGRILASDAGTELVGQYLPLAGLTQAQCRITYIWPYHPPKKRDPLPEEIDAGYAALIWEIEQTDPDYIITMGAVASALFVDFDNWQMVHGRKFTWEGRSVVPVIHPMNGLSGGKTMNLIQQDFVDLGRYIRGESVNITAAPKRYYGLLNRPNTELMGKIVGVDTETVDDKPWMIQISVEPGVAYYCLVDDPVEFPLFKEIIENAFLVVYHFATFDHDILSQCGIHPKRFTDTMQMAYLLGNQHQSLKALAFRHLGHKMHTYLETIRPSTLRRAKAYLSQIADHTVTHTRVFRTKKLWTAYKKYAGLKTLSVEFERLESKEWQVTWTLPTLPDPAPVDKIEGKTVKTTYPTNIVKRVRSLLDKLTADPTIDPVKKWTDMSNKDDAIERFGPMPEGALDDIPIEDAMNYACCDADMTLQLYYVLWPMVVDARLESALQADMDIIDDILAMQDNGLLVDVPYFEKFDAELTTRMQEQDMWLQMELLSNGFLHDDEVYNPNNHLMVAELLEYLNINVKSTEAKYLQQYVGNPIVKAHLAYKSLSKLRSTYVRNLLTQARTSPDGRVRSHFNINIADTGRLTSSKPVNWQNIPTRSTDGKRIRGGIIAAPGHSFVNPDYAGIEMRVAAHMAQDKRMMEIFNNDGDVHTLTVCYIEGCKPEDVHKDKRTAYKTVGFGVMYGMSAAGLYDTLKMNGTFKLDGTLYTEQECAVLISEWFKLYNGIATMMRGFHDEARRTGVVRDMFGRYRRIPEVSSMLPRLVGAGERQAGNAPIQSSAQGIIKRGMGQARVLRTLARDFDAKLCNQIHDELMYEVPDEHATTFGLLVKDIMENAVKLSVPVLVDVEIGKVWSEMKEYDFDTMEEE